MHRATTVNGVVGSRPSCVADGREVGGSQLTLRGRAGACRHGAMVGHRLIVPRRRVPAGTTSIERWPGTRRSPRSRPRACAFDGSATATSTRSAPTAPTPRWRGSSRGGTTRVEQAERFVRGDDRRGSGRAGRPVPVRGGAARGRRARRRLHARDRCGRTTVGRDRVHDGAGLAGPRIRDRRRRGRSSATRSNARAWEPCARSTDTRNIASIAGGGAAGHAARRHRAHDVQG